MDGKRCLQATPTPGSVSVATGGVAQDDGLNIKEEPTETGLDAGPAALQHMDADTRYRRHKRNVSCVKEERDPLEETSTLESEPLLMKEASGLEVNEDFADSQQDMDRQRCPQATSTPAINTSMNVVAGGVVQDDGLNIKEEWADTDMDIGPTVLQHMDTPYRSVQPDVSIIKQEDRSEDNTINPVLCGGVKEETNEDEQRADTDAQRSDEVEQRARSQSYSCDKCATTYTSKGSLLAHNESLHSTESHKCTKCNKKFPSKSYLYRHTSYSHSEQEYECAVCKKICRSKAALNKHVYRVHRPRPAVTSPVVRTCEYCHKTYASKSGLNRHTYVEHTKVRYRCSECKKEFTGKTNLRTHVRRVHSKEEHEGSETHFYICDYCKKIFTKRDSVRRHIGVVHLSGSYKCHQCNKIFKCKEYLMQHKTKVHTAGSKPTCDYCKKMFNNKGNIRSHIAHLHSSGSYTCFQCNKIFKCKAYLMKHMTTVHAAKVHTAGLQIHKCEYCQKTFRDTSSLKRHTKNIHVAAHIHRCWRCNRNFKSNDELQQHDISIHGKPQYKCQVCLKCYKTIYTLRRHFKKAHNSKDIQFQSDVHPHEMPDLRLTADVTNAAASTSKQQHNVSVVKEEPADGELELGPVVFQHMDCNYRPYKEEPQDGLGGLM